VKRRLRAAAVLQEGERIPSAHTRQREIGRALVLVAAHECSGAIAVPLAGFMGADHLPTMAQIAYVSSRWRGRRESRTRGHAGVSASDRYCQADWGLPTEGRCGRSWRSQSTRSSCLIFAF
jgi:hypothetical protein